LTANLVAVIGRPLRRHRRLAGLLHWLFTYELPLWLMPASASQAEPTCTDQQGRSACRLSK
jgi:hypothetical protein